MRTHGIGLGLSSPTTIHDHSDSTPESFYRDSHGSSPGLGVERGPYVVGFEEPVVLDHAVEFEEREGPVKLRWVVSPGSHSASASERGRSGSAGSEEMDSLSNSNSTSTSDDADVDGEDDEDGELEEWGSRSMEPLFCGGYTQSYTRAESERYLSSLCLSLILNRS